MTIGKEHVNADNGENNASEVHCLMVLMLIDVPS